MPIPTPPPQSPPSLIPHSLPSFVKNFYIYFIYEKLIHRTNYMRTRNLRFDALFIVQRNARLDCIIYKILWAYKPRGTRILATDWMLWQFWSQSFAIGNKIYLTLVVFHIWIFTALILLITFTFGKMRMKYSQNGCPRSIFRGNYSKTIDEKPKLKYTIRKRKANKRWTAS